MSNNRKRLQITHLYYEIVHYGNQFLVVAFNFQINRDRCTKRATAHWT